MYRYLGISLEKLLMLDTLKGSKILGGAAGITNRITKVNVMEVPDIVEWVGEGEFLITTAYSIKDNIDILIEIIPKLKEKGVVGLGIKVGRYVKELPEHIIQLADKLSFPIIEVPFCVSHTDIISIVLTEVISEQTNMLIKMEEFNREVMDIMIKGGELKEIAQKLYDNIDNSLAIYENMNDNCEIICSEDINKNEIEKIIYEYIGSKCKSESAYRHSTDEINSRNIERITIPIVIEKVEYGYIFIWLNKKELVPLDNMLIESYVHIIALEFFKKLSLYNMESNYKLEFLDDLLSHSEKRQKRAMEKSKTFNFHKELNHSVIIILIKELYDLDKFTYTKANFAQETTSSLLFIINRMIKRHNVKLVYAEKSDRIVMIYGSEENKSSQEIKKEIISFCRKILSEALKSFEPDQLAIGIGRSYSEEGQLWKSHEQAKLIVENLNKTNNASIVHYDDLGLYRILSYDGLQSELIEFCADTIKPLIEYDKENNSELVKTLKNYFQYNGNMKKISEKMYMHYNTIVYRLQKIKDITGMDIDNGDSRLNLEIALKIMDLIDVH